MSLDPSEKCLAIIHQGVLYLQRGNFAKADRLFAQAIQAATSLPKDDAYSLFPLTLFHLSLLRIRQGKPDEAAQTRSVAMIGLDAIELPMQDGLFQGLMADALIALQEYRRAIPFLEYTANAFAESEDVLGVASMLDSIGNCYCRSGLKDHGVIPLRAAVKIYRDHPGDPHLPVALHNLGIALAQSSPSEAEQAYLEAAAIYTAKLQLLSAAPAWVNLGVLCAKQDRNAEALAWYEKALHIRQASASASPESIARLLNNIANCQRRTGEFEQAHILVDRAVALLKPRNFHTLASTCGTRGLIFRDEGRDSEAAEWLQKAVVEHLKAPTPNIESIAADLEYLVEILERLDRREEVAAAQAQLDTIRATQRDTPAAAAAPATAGVDAAGAVTIELDCSNLSTTRYSVADAIQLADRLSAALDRTLGHYAGRVMIPESTTLLFYGPDSEALFHVLEPVLEGHPIAEGAHISLRQGTRLREVGLPARMM